MAKRRARRPIPELQDRVSGLATQQRKMAFFELADQLAHASDGGKQKRLKEELARMTFGKP